MKYSLKKCIRSPNLKERKVCAVMASLLASLGIFLGLYLSGISSLKLSLCVLGIWVCLCRWDERLTHKSQWQYQVKKSLQSLCTFCWYAITVFHDIVQNMEHGQEKEGIIVQKPHMLVLCPIYFHCKMLLLLIIKSQDFPIG